VDTFDGGDIPPDFGWSDVPARPVVPVGNLSNLVTDDRDGNVRADLTTPGAYSVGGVGQPRVTLPQPDCRFRIKSATPSTSFDRRQRRRWRHDQSVLRPRHDLGKRQRDLDRDRRGCGGQRTGVYSWSTAGLSPGTYYIAGQLSSGGDLKLSHLTRAITILAPPPPFHLTSPTPHFQGGQNVTIAWTAGNIVAGSKISLCYDRDRTWFNGNATWIETNQIAAADGDGAYIWNTQGREAGHVLHRRLSLRRTATARFRFSRDRSRSCRRPRPPSHSPAQHPAATAGARRSPSLGRQLRRCRQQDQPVYDRDTICQRHLKGIEVNRFRSQTATCAYRWNTRA